MDKVHYSSNKDDWETPPELFAKLDAEFHFNLDPCCTHKTAKCERHYTEDEDGLQQGWGGNGVVAFVNPPYGRVLPLWIKKCWEEAQKGATVVMLIPSRTDTSYWHDYCFKGEVRFLRGRVKFVGGKSCAPFPSAVVIFRPEIDGGK